MGKVGEQRAKGTKVILRPIFPNREITQRVGRKRTMIVSQYHNVDMEGNHHAFLSVVDLGCC